jgi:hypothetical protein
MTNIGQAGSRHPSPKVGQARIRPHHGHQPRESHLRFHLYRPKRASKLREGIHHSPSPPSPTSADSEHPSRRETWSANICSPGNGPSRGGERRWILHPTEHGRHRVIYSSSLREAWLPHNYIILLVARLDSTILQPHDPRRCPQCSCLLTFQMAHIGRLNNRPDAEGEARIISFRHTLSLGHQCQDRGMGSPRQTLLLPPGRRAKIGFNSPGQRVHPHLGTR